MTTIGRFLGFVALIIGFAWLARRLLGATRVSWVRALVAGLAGIAAGTAIAAGLRRWGVQDDGSAVAAAFVAAVLVSMGLVVAFQLIARPSSAPRRHGGSPAGAVATVRRSAEVVRIATHHGLGNYLGRGRAEPVATPVQLRRALEEAGVVFVKFGQLLAGRPDVVGAAFAAELGTLRHDVTPLDRDVMERELVRALPDADRRFASIEWAPLGSASIAQVYAAELTDGTSVVVKVRRPGIDEDVRRDGRVIVDLAHRVERHSSWARTAGIADLADAFVRDLERELDYSAEVRAAEELASSFEDSDIGIPAVHPELSSGSVLVMDRVEGRPLSATSLDGWAPEERRSTAMALVAANVSAMLDGARFHADPHPGNVMVGDDRQLWLIDFGATGVLSSTERSALSSLLLGLRLREPALLRDSLLEIATTDGPVDIARLDRALGQFLAEHVRPSENLGPDAVAALMRIMHDEHLRVPALSSSMFRSLVTVLDSLAHIDPDLAVLDGIEEISSVQSPVPSSAGDLASLARDETLKLLPLLRRAPRLTDSVVTQLDRGDLTIRSRLLSHPDDVRVVTTLVNRLVLALVAGVLGIVSVMLFGLEQGPYLSTDFSIYDLVATIGLLSGAVLVMRVVLEALETDDLGSR